MAQDASLQAVIGWIQMATESKISQDDAATFAQRMLDSGFKQGAEVLDHHRRWPLHFAARNGWGGLAKALIDVKADLEGVNHASLTPLHMAASAGKEEASKVLIDAKANVEAATPQWGWRPLHLASTGAVAQALLDAGADVHAADRNGERPLHIAAYGSGKLEVAKALIGAGADLNVAGKTGERPLHRAAYGEGSLEVAKELIAARADIEAADEDGRRPLHIAAQRHVVGVVRALLDAKADPEATDWLGRTAASAIDCAADANEIKTLLAAPAELGDAATRG